MSKRRMSRESRVKRQEPKGEQTRSAARVPPSAETSTNAQPSASGLAPAGQFDPAELAAVDDGSPESRVESQEPESQDAGGDAGVPPSDESSTNGQPSAGGLASDDQDPDASDAAPSDDPPAPPTDEVSDIVLLGVPVDTCQPGYATRYVDMRLTPRQAAALKFEWCSLSERGERFAGGRSSHPDGTTVENGNDGLRWLLDRLADAIEAKTGKKLVSDFGLSFH